MNDMKNRKIVIVTHGSLASGFISSLNVIMGGIKDVNEISYVEIYGETSNNEVVETISGIIEENFDKEIIILTDIVIGSSTANSITAISSHEHKNIHVIAGVNLSFVLAILTLERGVNLENKINEIVEHNREMLVYLNENGDD